MLKAIRICYCYCCHYYHYCCYYVGLFGEHVPSPELDRRATNVQSEPLSTEEDQSSSAKQQLECHLDSGHIFPQREERQVPQSHNREPNADTGEHRKLVVCHQVSPAFLSVVGLVVVIEAVTRNLFRVGVFLPSFPSLTFLFPSFPAAKWIQLKHSRDRC